MRAILSPFPVEEARDLVDRERARVLEADRARLLAEPGALPAREAAGRDPDRLAQLVAPQSSVEERERLLVPERAERLHLAPPARGHAPRLLDQARVQHAIRAPCDPLVEHRDRRIDPVDPRLVAASAIAR